MKTLDEIVYTIASKGGKDEDDSFLIMVEELVHKARAMLLKQRIDKHGVLPWMCQTIRLPLERSMDCMSYIQESVSVDKLPRALRSNNGTYARDVFLADGQPVLIVQETDDYAYSHIEPPAIRTFLRNDRIVLRGNADIRELRIRDVFENPSEVRGICCDPLQDYPIHSDMIPALIQMVEQLIYNDADVPRDMVEVQREAGQ